MTVTGAPTPIPATAPAPHKASLARWLALGAFIAGLALAVVGVWAAVGSYQREQSIKDFARANHTTEYIIEQEPTVTASVNRLVELNAADVTLNQQIVAADATHNTNQFNQLTTQANTTSDEQETLHNQLTDFQHYLADAAR